ncbi:MAG: hypothetical protein U9Q40_00630 [Campylobacterota bacterium]|nr:hypothetical protein [Campylobacterota bacterium]
MTHNFPYTFRADKGRILQYKHNKQISRLFSFSYNKSKHVTKFPLATYDTKLASVDSEGKIIVIDIFTRRKRVIKSDIANISSISFLGKNYLLTSVNNYLVIHNYKTLHSKKISSQPIIDFLKSTKEPSLKLLSSTILEPLVATKEFSKAFTLVSDNFFLKETIGYKKLDEIYRSAFYKAVQALCREDIKKASKYLEKFKNTESKKLQISALFQDFKHYERFTLHIKEKKYAIAYAISSKHSSLTLTEEYKEMEAVFSRTFGLAKSQMQLYQYKEAKETLSDYLTILSKREQIKNLLDGKDVENRRDAQRLKLLRLYEKDDFKGCYEHIDRSKIEDLELVELLEKHWIKLMLKCEELALSGNIKEIKIVLGELISTQTRADKIGDILRVAFYSKIETLIKKRSFNSAQNIIYSYIDIFGEDIEIRSIMKKFESDSTKKLAITHRKSSGEIRYSWLNSEFIVEY